MSEAFVRRNNLPREGTSATWQSLCRKSRDSDPDDSSNEASSADSEADDYKADRRTQRGTQNAKRSVPQRNASKRANLNDDNAYGGTWSIAYHWLVVCHIQEFLCEWTWAQPLICHSPWQNNNLTDCTKLFAYTAVCLKAFGESNLGHCLFPTDIFIKSNTQSTSRWNQ